MSRAPPIQTHDLRNSFGRHRGLAVALDGPNLEIAKGEFVSIMGAGFGQVDADEHQWLPRQSPAQEAYLCDGVDVSSLDAEELARLRPKIGFVFQGSTCSRAWTPCTT
jgi:putative ABC transport system ATP-binding protein